jgi:uncharacterized membrane protein
MHGLSWPKRVFLILASVFYVFAGILHFVRPDMYLKIMPPYIPWHVAMVGISGVCEILGGLGLLVPVTRRMAAWGLVALLIAVFPANLYMATNPVETGTAGLSAAIRWGRLPLQVVFIAWVLWCSKGTPRLMRPAFHKY